MSLLRHLYYALTNLEVDLENRQDVLNLEMKDYLTVQKAESPFHKE